MREVRSDAALFAAVNSTHYGYAPDQDETMPYIIYSVISTEQTNVFSLTDSWDESIVQFSIFDKNQSVSYITGIFDKLVSCFDRAVIIYESDTAIGCSREGSTGPTRLEDCWMMTVDYRMSYV